MKTDTIAAIATGLSNAGISIIRLSGKEVFTIIDQIFRTKTGNKTLSKEKSHTVHYGFIADGEQVIDEVMVIIMRAPASYTKEDVIEIDCHGGIVGTKKILETVIKYGARIAEPGEFTKRAFLNGRIDLSQAEAVMDIIRARSELSLKNSVSQLRGNVQQFIRKQRNVILRDIAFIETALDDPEHISIEGFSDILLEHVEEECMIIEQLIRESENGRIIKEGIKTVIVGKPNAGKSSLLNILLGEDRAIVTDIAGTTRDTLEETINLNGIILNIVDTAGIRDTRDTIEKIGVEKAIRFTKDADLILYVVDSSIQLDENDEAIFEMIQDKKAIILFNKADLESVLSMNEIKKKTNKDIISFSTKENIGIIELEDKIKEMFFNGEIDFNDEIYITNARHKQAFMDALESLKQVKQSIEAEMPEDFYSIDLMSAYEYLGNIIGESVEEDLVNLIFKEFCVGK